MSNLPGTLDGLNAAQREAAETLRGPVRILAGPGTGKTRTITHRIAEQVRSGVAAPSQILAVTFTDRAAAELRERLAALGAGGVQAATFHAAALRQLRHFWHHVEEGPFPDVLDSKLPLLRASAARHRVQAADLAAAIEWAKARCVPPEGYVEAAAGRAGPLPAATMAEVYARYEDDKRARNLLDFDDMLARATALFTAVDAAAAEFRDRYRFFTVDEFQDVNTAQWRLLLAWLGPSRELCVVGDDLQAIYGFTGASPRWLLEFDRAFPEAVTIRLTENYRSSPQVLALANRLAPAGRRLTAVRADGAPPRLLAHRDGPAEVSGVVAQVRALLERGVPGGEIAVCYRVNAQSEPFEDALKRARIPHVVRGDRGFYERPEVRQALQALGRAAAAGVDDEPPGPGGSVAAGPRAHRLAEQVLRDQLSWHPRREPDGERAKERWRNLSALMEAITGLVTSGAATTVTDVVAELHRRADAGLETVDEGGAVVLTTLHRAKGLEFEAVFLVSVEEDTLPYYRAETEEELAEERNLFFVGVTRAKTELTLSWAAKRPTPWGRWQERRPSRFLIDVGLVDPPPARKERAPAVRSAAPGGGGRAGAEEPLFEALRSWRAQRARRDGVPAYVVAPDATLVAVAASRPHDLVALGRVPGFGPKRVREYGQEVLAILADA